MLPLFTVFTYQKRIPLFDRKQRNEKEAQILVCSFQICLLQATRRTQPWCFINCLCLGLDAGYEEKHLFVARDLGLVTRILKLF